MANNTIMDKIEIFPQTGHVGVRIQKQILDGNGRLQSFEYHRTMIDPDVNPALQMAAVNAHLAAMGYPAVKAAEAAFLSGVVAAPAITTLRTDKAEASRAAQK